MCVIVFHHNCALLFKFIESGKELQQYQGKQTLYKQMLDPALKSRNTPGLIGQRAILKVKRICECVVVPVGPRKALKIWDTSSERGLLYCLLLYAM